MGNIKHNYFYTKDQAFKNLACKIILTAINDLFDLRYGRKIPKADCNIKELYNFFHSEYFYLLSNGIDGADAWKKLNEDFNKGIDYNFHD